MASSSNTTWIKGFSGNPDGEARGEAPLGKLVNEIGSERVTYPAGGDDALRMTRREALARTLWTRGVIDGDMTAVKLLVELLEGKGAGAGEGAQFNADQYAAAEAALRAWEAGRAGDTKEVTSSDGRQ
jgi:hypothetical protein